ncbi:MAG: MFS transporter [Ilumatobacteraceae bacterium]
MMYPFLPTFITGVLGAPVVAVGVAEGLADATAARMKLVAGRLAASGRRRRWIAAGYGLATVGKVIVALAFVWLVVLLGRVVDRFGKGIRGVPRDALIADDVPARTRGRAFGFHRSLDTLGAVIGPLVGLALYRLVGQRIRQVLLLAVIPAMVSVALVAAMVRERPMHPIAVVPVASPTPRPHLPAGFWHVMLPVGVFALVNSTDALLLLRAQALGFGVTEIVLVYVAYNIVYAGLAYPAGKLADRVSPRVVFASGLVIFAVTYLGLGQTNSANAAWILLPFYGAYAALTDGVSRAWISNIVAEEQRTWALGVHGATTGLAVLIAGTLVRTCLARHLHSPTHRVRHHRTRRRRKSGGHPSKRPSATRNLSSLTPNSQSDIGLQYEVFAVHQLLKQCDENGVRGREPSG